MKVWIRHNRKHTSFRLDGCYVVTRSSDQQTAKELRKLARELDPPLWPWLALGGIILGLIAFIIFKTPTTVCFAQEAEITRLSAMIGKSNG